MITARRITAWLVAAIVTVGVGYASRAPYSPRGADQSLLRMSWRLRGEKLQSCRPRTEEELERLPVHMRTPQVCTGHLVSYRLAVRIDDRPADTLTFAPAGAKGDRPIFVLHDSALTPGPHDVEVDFTPMIRHPDVKQKPLHYRATVNARRGHIELITLTRDASALTLME